MVFGGVQPAVPHDVLHQLLIVLCNSQVRNQLRASSPNPESQSLAPSSPVCGRLDLGSWGSRAGSTRLGCRRPVLTIIGDIGDLEAPGAVGLTGFEVDPEFARAGGESDGSLVGLARLIGGDGRWGGCGGTARD